MSEVGIGTSQTLLQLRTLGEFIGTEASTKACQGWQILLHARAHLHCTVQSSEPLKVKLALTAQHYMINYAIYWIQLHLRPIQGSVPATFANAELMMCHCFEYFHHKHHLVTILLEYTASNFISVPQSGIVSIGIAMSLVQSALSLIGETRKNPKKDWHRLHSRACQGPGTKAPYLEPFIFTLTHL